MAFLKTSWRCIFQTLQSDSVAFVKTSSDTTSLKLYESCSVVFVKTSSDTTSLKLYESDSVAFAKTSSDTTSLKLYESDSVAFVGSSLGAASLKHSLALPSRVPVGLEQRSFVPLDLNITRKGEKKRTPNRWKERNGIYVKNFLFYKHCGSTHDKE